MNSIPKTLSLLILPFIFLTSCDNTIPVYTPDPEDTTSDFRDQYVGKYQTTLTRYFGPSAVCERDTSVSDFVVSVDYGPTSSTLSFMGRTVHLDSAGWYQTTSFKLRLWNDSIYSWAFYVHGCPLTEIYEGYKISDNPN